MILEDFIAKWTGQYCTSPGGYGRQCVDLANEYLLECLLDAQDHANAKDWFTNFDPEKFFQITNTPTNSPLKGDLIIWSPSTNPSVDPYGHIAIATGNKTNANGFESFDQNWPLNSPCHLQYHTYTTPAGINVIGWLRPKQAIQTTQPPKEGDDMTDDQKNALEVLRPLVDSKQYGNLEGAARAGAGALIDEVNNLAKMNQLAGQLDTANKTITSLTVDNKDLAKKLGDCQSASAVTKADPVAVSTIAVAPDPFDFSSVALIGALLKKALIKLHIPERK